MLATCSRMSPLELLPEAGASYPAGATFPYNDAKEAGMRAENTVTGVITCARPGGE